MLEELEAAGYTTFVGIAEDALPVLLGIFDTLDTFTVVAPTNDAFQGQDELLASLSTPEAAADFVLGLIEEDKSSLAELVAAGAFDPFQGSPLPVAGDPASQVTIGGAAVVDPDRQASNGIIQGVSTLPVLPS